MTQLFGAKWINKEGDVLLSGDRYSESFILWVRKTADLTDDQWKAGFLELERRVQENSSRCLESWPPSYIEFIGMCKTSRSPLGINAGAYKTYKPERILEDHAAKERAIEARDKAIFDLKGLLC
jgi:hypothetical protein